MTDIVIKRVHGRRPPIAQSLSGFDVLYDPGLGRSPPTTSPPP